MTQNQWDWGLDEKWVAGKRERVEDDCKVSGLHGAWIMAPLTDPGNKGQRDKIL